MMKEYYPLNYSMRSKALCSLLAAMLLAGTTAPTVWAVPRSNESDTEASGTTGALFKIEQKARPDNPGLTVSADDPLQNLTARSAVVMDAQTGRVLYDRDMRARRFPASTTKIMTLIIALEHCQLDEMVTVSSHAAGTEGSTLWLEAGDQVPMGELLKGMIMRSGNDATVAVAEHVAGSVEAFARMMTEKAHEIGAEDTSFVNSSGLPDDNHYTTAYDLALIASYGYREVPHFEEMVSTKEATFPWVKDETHQLRSENQMLWLYRGGNGVKTGYTEAAGRCLVSGAKNDGIQLVTVVLDSVYMWNDSIALLDYGFAQVDSHELVKQGEPVKKLPVLSGKQKEIPVVAAESVVLSQDKQGTGSEYEKVYELPHTLEAPVKAGDKVGELIVRYEGHECRRVDLLAGESVEQKSFFRTVYQYACQLLGLHGR